jgi:hypothetical protein
LVCIPNWDDGDWDTGLEAISTAGFAALVDHFHLEDVFVLYTGRMTRWLHLLHQFDL